METISTDRIAKELSAYGLAASEELCSRIHLYIHTLLRWNAMISLTAVTEPVEIVRFHFGESIFAFTSGLITDGRLADVGSGAGFPGLPLYLVCPSIELTMLESNRRKCVFLQEIVRQMGVENGVQVWHGRMDGYASDLGRSKFDRISSRAVGRWEDILSFAKGNMNIAGKLVLWVGCDDASKIARNYSRDWEWSIPLRIPNSDHRYLISGTIP
jgi:16S rRNA (guanine527-N7)-methyltransferase